MTDDSVCAALAQTTDNQSTRVCALTLSRSSQQRQVSAESAQKFSDKLNIAWLETSAKTASNVDAAFLTMSKQLIAAKERQQAQQQSASNQGSSGAQQARPAAQGNVALNKSAAPGDSYASQCCK